MAVAVKGVVVLTELLAQTVEVARAALAYIDAIPSGTDLPIMPGFDRDWAEDILKSAEALVKE